MRVWDINPGYLSNKNLLGEHTEIHAIYSVITNDKKGYSNHPETKRWTENLYCLKLRHDLIVSEMLIRNYKHKSPVHYDEKGNYPKEFIDLPYKQLKILKNKYLLKNNVTSRIPIPKNNQELWSQHKYSVLARNPNHYKELGKILAKNKTIKIEELALELIEILRIPPLLPGLRNAIDHMFGYVSKYCSEKNKNFTLKDKLELIIKLAIKKNEKYLMHSTALSYFNLWIKYRQQTNE